MFMWWRGLCLLLVMLSLSTRAEERPLRVTINDVEPYTIHQPNDARGGMHMDILNALIRTSGLSMESTSVVYVRIAAALKDGSADLVVGVEGPELDALADRVVPFHSFHSVVIPRAGLGIDRIESLRGRHLGIARGAFYDERINNDDAIIKDPIADPFQGVRMLSFGRLDAVISSDYLLHYALRQTGLDRKQFDPIFVVNERRYTMYARKGLDPAIIRQLQRAMGLLQRKGELERILDRYQ